MPCMVRGVISSNGVVESSKSPSRPKSSTVEDSPISHSCGGSDSLVIVPLTAVQEPSWQEFEIRASPRCTPKRRMDPTMSLRNSQSISPAPSSSSACL